MNPYPEFLIISKTNDIQKSLNSFLINPSWRFTITDTKKENIQLPVNIDKYTVFNLKLTIILIENSSTKFTLNLHFCVTMRTYNSDIV